MRLTFTTRPKTPAAVVQDFENSGGFHLCLIEFWSRVNDGLRIDLSGRCALRTEAAVMFHQAEKTECHRQLHNFICAGLRRRRARVQIAAATLSGNSLRQAVHTHRASVHQAAKLVAALLRVAGVTAGLAESKQATAGFDSRRLQADCQEPGSAPEPYAR